MYVGYMSNIYIYIYQIWTVIENLKNVCVYGKCLVRVFLFALVCAKLFFLPKLHRSRCHIVIYSNDQLESSKWNKCAIIANAVK